MKRVVTLLSLAFILLFSGGMFGQGPGSIDPDLDDEWLDEDLGGDDFDDLEELEDLDDEFDGVEDMTDDDRDDLNEWNEQGIED